jgi:hypothetical protein
LTFVYEVLSRPPKTPQKPVSATKFVIHAHRCAVRLGRPSNDCRVVCHGGPARCDRRLSRVGRPAAKAQLLATSRSALDAALVGTLGRRLWQGWLTIEASISGSVLCKPLQRGSDRIVLLLPQVAALGAADNDKLDLYPKWGGTPTLTSRSSARMHRCRGKGVLVDGWIAGHLVAGSPHLVRPGRSWTGLSRRRASAC